jgi:hypothetical protein
VTTTHNIPGVEFTFSLRLSRLEYAEFGPQIRSNYSTSGIGLKGKDGLDSAAMALQQNWPTVITIVGLTEIS